MAFLSQVSLQDPSLRAAQLDPGFRIVPGQATPRHQDRASAAAGNPAAVGGGSSPGRESDPARTRSAGHPGIAHGGLLLQVPDVEDLGAGWPGARGRRGGEEAERQLRPHQDVRGGGTESTSLAGEALHVGAVRGHCALPYAEGRGDVQVYRHTVQPTSERVDSEEHADDAGGERDLLHPEELFGAGGEMEIQHPLYAGSGGAESVWTHHGAVWLQTRD